MTAPQVVAPPASAASSSVEDILVSPKICCSIAVPKLMAEYPEPLAAFFAATK